MTRFPTGFAVFLFFGACGSGSMAGVADVAGIADMVGVADMDAGAPSCPPSGVWMTEIVDTEGEGWGLSLAVGPDGILHLVYQRRIAKVLDTYLYYSTRDDESWHSELIAEHSLGSVALDSSGGAHIAYLEERGKERLAYARRAGDSWLTDYLFAGSDGCSSTCGGQPVMQYDGKKKLRTHVM